MIKRGIWHNLSLKDALVFLETDSNKGLTSEEAEGRRKGYGKNLIEEEKKSSALVIFLTQFKSPLVYILIVAGVITAFLQIWTDTIVILIAVLLNAVFGFWEERKVSKTLEKLNKVLKTPAIVLRDGNRKMVFQEELVPGDIVLLEAGKKVPADGRLIEVNGLKVSEAALTGEWLPDTKHADTLSEETSLVDRNNMAYMGSLVEEGEGKMVVTETGGRTEIGKIARLVRETGRKKTPLQKKLIGFTKLVALVIGLIALAIFVEELITGGENLVGTFETAVAIAVGGIPEALPIVMTVILAIGTNRILKKKGLIKKLSSVETLGSAQVICLDKTRTLTVGKMEPAEIIAKDKERFLKAIVSANSAFVENPESPPEEWKIDGSPTEEALVKAGWQNKVSKPELEKNSKEVMKVPFKSELKYSLSLREESGKLFLYIAGAPEMILEKVVDKGNWPGELDTLLRNGRRVIGGAFKEIKKNVSEIKNLDDEAKEMEFAGLVALKDPLRFGIGDAIAKARKAGMKPVIITGDHKETALSVAREIGLEVDEKNILEGRELDKLSNEELFSKVEEISVYSRSAPEHKMRIIEAWQKKGKVVAMIGDGVNDAPALKRADIGVSLGSGTEVAKEASELILLDDSFATIVEAIKEGRVVLDNIRKGITYVMANSFASAVIVGLATAFGWPLPILAVQILWNNIVEDSLPNLSFAFEPPEEGVMNRQPVPRKSPLLTKEMKTLMFATGIIYQAFGLAIFAVAWKVLGLDLSYARTMVFGLLVVNTAFVIFGYKNLRKNITKYNPFSNKVLNLTALIIMVFFALSIYLPVFQTLLQTVPLGFGSWMVLIGISVASLLLIEITKLIFIAKKETE